MSRPYGSHVTVTGLSQLEVDITFGSMDPTLGQTHFTLPPINHSVDYDDEEAEMDELLEKMDKAFPEDLSHGSKHEQISAYQIRKQATQGLSDGLIYVMHSQKPKGQLSRRTQCSA